MLPREWLRRHAWGVTSSLVARAVEAAGAASWREISQPTLRHTQILRCDFPHPAGKIALLRAFSAPAVAVRPKMTQQDLSQLGVGTSTKIVYAVSGAPSHDRAGHYECAARVPSIVRSLSQHDITPDARPSELCLLKNTRTASLEDVTAIHDPAYVAGLQRTISEQAPTVVADHDQGDTDCTYVTPTSFADALKASGTAMSVVDAVVSASRMAAGTVASGGQGLGEGSGAATPAGYAIMRPPGHHATESTPMGFCLLNNVAIAARYAQQHHGLKKVLILDHDVHHGNGTQDIFYNDPSVLFMDMHEHEVWPGSGQLEEAGAGPGEGYTINIPLPECSGDEAVKRVLDRVIEPAARRFAPDIILISAGYDAHWRDPLEKLNFQSATYHRIARRMKQLANELCGGRIVFLLEGGYSLQGLSEGVTEAFLGLLGDSSAHPLEDLPAEPLAAVDDVLSRLTKLHGL